MYKPENMILLNNQTGKKLLCFYNGPYEILEDMSPNIKIWKNNKPISSQKYLKH